MPHLYCGTSGFAYATWKPDFYPADVPSKKFLSHYAERLNAVEINYTFRRLPSAATLESWVAATRAGFIFGLKAHMRITHIQKLQQSEFIGVFFKAIDPLRTAAFKCDLPLLEEFLAGLPEGLRYAFEFRIPLGTTRCTRLPSRKSWFGLLLVIHAGAGSST
jgi:uncharacterized protein YecE (DUF72 family)